MISVYSEYHRLHRSDQVFIDGQPFILEETPARAEILREAVRQAGLGPVVAPQDHGLAPILAAHTGDYVEYLRTAFEESARYYHSREPVIPETFAVRHSPRKPGSFIGKKGYYAFGIGSPVLEGTWQAAYWSAQCALTAARLVQREGKAAGGKAAGGKAAGGKAAGGKAAGIKVAGEKFAYAICRPPGHHAAHDMMGGFCYLNNAAIAARFLGGRVAILDIDYHHGNGTQIIFYNDPSVLFCSLHAHPDDDYPFYWGSQEERGEGEGLGYTCNWPLPPGTEDGAYLAALDQALHTIQSFGPDALVLSAGLDIVAHDPVGGFRISRAGLQAIGERIAALDLPTVIVQEGGYLMEELAENATALLSPFCSPAVTK